MEGNVPMPTQLSAAVIDVIPSVPPPAFEMLNTAEELCGLAAIAVNDSSEESTLSCAGAAVTVSVTPMVWVLPAAHAVELQLTVTVPE